jgi:hypothetical protein
MKDNSAIYEMRVKSLDWMLECFKKGTIRKRTIISLIPKKQLVDLLDWLVVLERYEDCVIVKEVLDIVYEK